MISDLGKQAISWVNSAEHVCEVRAPGHRCPAGILQEEVQRLNLELEKMTEDRDGRIAIIRGYQEFKHKKEADLIESNRLLQELERRVDNLDRHVREHSLNIYALKVGDFKSIKGELLARLNAVERKIEERLPEDDRNAQLRRAVQGTRILSIEERLAKLEAKQ